MSSVELPKRVGDYILLKHLAKGGMGDVFLARPANKNSLQRVVALKCLRADLAHDETFVEMFLTEARILASLNHPNIVQALEVNQDGAFYYIVMEFVHGHDMASVMRRLAMASEALPTQYAIYTMIGVARALGFAHAAVDAEGHALQLVHRDINPANIFVSFQGEVKIGDFGIARTRSGPRTTEPGAIRGKVGYFSPEQVHGGTLDGRSDIFVMGLVLYELVNGFSLLKSTADHDVVQEIADWKTPNLDAVAVLPCGMELVGILRRALAPNPSDRYSAATEMASDLAKLIGDGSGCDATMMSAMMQRMWPDEVESWPAALRTYAHMSEVAPSELPAQEPLPSVVPLSVPVRLWRRTGKLFHATTALGTVGVGLLRLTLWIAVFTWAAHAIHMHKSMADMLVAGMPSTEVPTPRAVIGLLESELKPTAQVGYIAVRARKTKGLRITLDGETLASFPIGVRAVACGKHEVGVYQNGRPVRRLEVMVTPRHTRRAPLLLVED